MGQILQDQTLWELRNDGRNENENRNVNESRRRNKNKIVIRSRKWEIALRTKIVALEQKELKTLNKALNNEWHNRMPCMNHKAAI